MNDIAALESLLFVAGDEGVSLKQVAHILNVTTQHAYQLLMQLQKECEASETRGLMLIEIGDTYQLATKKEYAEIIKSFAISPLATSLSQASLETLAIIAYKQPITRMEIDEIRGVQTTGALQKLLVRGLIQEVGRVDGPGRAILYGTTKYFMDYFGLKEMGELPAIDALELEDTDNETDLFFEKFNQQMEETQLHEEIEIDEDEEKMDLFQIEE